MKEWIGERSAVGDRPARQAVYHKSAVIDKKSANRKDMARLLKAWRLWIKSDRGSAAGPEPPSQAYLGSLRFLSTATPSDYLALASSAGRGRFLKSHLRYPERGTHTKGASNVTLCHLSHLLRWQTHSSVANEVATFSGITIAPHEEQGKDKQCHACDQYLNIGVGGASDMADVSVASR